MLIMSDSRDLLSVGVDVGTTTTQIIFSRLNLQDVSRPGQIPRIDITARKVIYQSPIVFTPLIDTQTIDADRLNEIVRRHEALRTIFPEREGEPVQHVMPHLSLSVDTRFLDTLSIDTGQPEMQVTGWRG